ncbi:MAG: YcxB family protein [Lachnospiraceae bacterium]|nr:YcxB family protein [Lachnospiraceae bacterium]
MEEMTKENEKQVMETEGTMENATEETLDENVEADTEDSVEVDEDPGKSVTFDVHMSSAVLYDYQMYYAYTSASGILGTCFGLLGIMLYLRYREQLLFLIIGIMLVLYTPIILKYRTFMAAKLNTVYRKPLHYEINKKGITVSQEEVTQTLPWENCTKAVTTPKSIVVYSGRKNACVFPKKDLGENLPALIAVIAENMQPSRVKINTNITL